MDDKDRIHEAYLRACDKVDQKTIANDIGATEVSLRGFKMHKGLGKSRLAALDSWLKENVYFDVDESDQPSDPMEPVFSMLGRKLELLASVMKDGRIPKNVRIAEFNEAIRSLPEISKECGL